MKEPAKQVYIDELNLQLKLCTWNDKWTHVVHKDDPLKIAKSVGIDGSYSFIQRVQHVYEHKRVDNPVVFGLMSHSWHPYQEITDTTPITIEEMKEQVVF